MRLAIVIGHSPGHGGAVAVDGVTEYDHHRHTAARVMARALEVGHTCRVFTRDDGAYSTVMPRLVGEVNAWSPDLVISLHFDAATAEHKGEWDGTSALHWPGSRAGRMYAVQLSAAVARAQGTRDRGAIARDTSWSGERLHILSDTRVPAVILETHFGDHAGDHRRATEARDQGETARAIVGALPRPGA